MFTSGRIGPKGKDHVVFIIQDKTATKHWLRPDPMSCHCVCCNSLLDDSTSFSLTISNLSFSFSSATISYTDILATSKERRSHLQEQYHFLCQCTRCTTEDKVSRVNSLQIYLPFPDLSHPPFILIFLFLSLSPHRSWKRLLPTSLCPGGIAIYHPCSVFRTLLLRVCSTQPSKASDDVSGLSDRP